MPVPSSSARRFVVRGRVQGVGFRDFIQRGARELGLTGWVRNDDDGTVVAYVVGPPDQLDRIASILHKGPRWADVRGVTVEDAAVSQCSDFGIQG